MLEEFREDLTKVQLEYEQSQRSAVVMRLYYDERVDNTNL